MSPAAKPRRTSPRWGVLLFSLAVVASISYCSHSGGKNDDPVTGQVHLSWPIPAPEGQVAKDLLAKNFYVVFDGSGSMRDMQCSGNVSKEVAAKSAMLAFMDKLPKGANLGLLIFDKAGMFERVPLAPYKRQPFVDALEQSQAGNGTPLGTSIALGFEKLAAQAGKQLGYGEYHLIVITDGMADNGNNPAEVVQTIAQNTPVIVHTIGFCIGSDHPLNQPGLVFYREANDPAQLAQGLDEVLAEEKEFKVDQFKP